MQTPKMNAKTSSMSDSDPKPYNHYNLYFILERELFLQANGVYPTRDRFVQDTEVDYTGLELPPLPSRYSSLVLHDDWFVSKKKYRAHTKSHGLISFREMAAMISTRWKEESSSWKEDGSEIRAFVRTVAERVKQRCREHRRSKSYRNKANQARVVQQKEHTMLLSEHVLLKLQQITPMAYREPFSCMSPPASQHTANSPEGKASRRLSSITALDLPDDEIFAMWSSC